MADFFLRFAEMIERALAWIGLENLASDILASFLVEFLKFAVPLLLGGISLVRSRIWHRTLRRVRSAIRVLAARAPAGQAAEPEKERMYLQWIEKHHMEGDDLEGPALPLPAWLSRDRRRHQRGRFPRRPEPEGLADRSKPGIRDIVRALSGFDKVIVLGEPGSGKSVALREHARSLARAGQEATRPPLLPLLVDLGEWGEFERAPRGLPTSVDGFLVWSLSIASEEKENSLFDRPLQYLASNLKDFVFEGRFVFLFDSLDELPLASRDEILKLLRQFSLFAIDRGNRVILAGRSLDDAPVIDAEILTLASLDRKSIEGFLSAHVPEQTSQLLAWIDRDESLRELAGTPFDLQVLAALYGEDRANEMAPESRGQLLALSVDRRLAREAAGKQRAALAAVPGGLESLERFLGATGFAMQRCRERGTSVAVEELEGLWASFPDGATFLEIAWRARLLEVRGRSRNAAGTRDTALLRFTHLRYQELFAAWELIHNGIEVTGELPFQDPLWEETVLLALDLTHEPRTLLNVLLARYRNQEIGSEIDRIRLLHLLAEAYSRLAAVGGLEPADSEIRQILYRDLEKVAMHEESRLRARGLRALFSLLGPAGSLSALERALADRSSWVREVALKMLLGLGLERLWVRRAVLRFLLRSFGRALLPRWPFPHPGRGEASGPLKLARLVPVFRQKSVPGLAALALSLAIVAAPISLGWSAINWLLIVAIGILLLFVILPLCFLFAGIIVTSFPLIFRLRPGNWLQPFHVNGDGGFRTAVALTTRLAPALLDYSVWVCAAVWLPYFLVLPIFFVHSVGIAAACGWEISRPAPNENHLGLLRGAVLFWLALALHSQPTLAVAFGGLGALQLAWYWSGGWRWIKLAAGWVFLALVLVSLLLWWAFWSFDHTTRNSSPEGLTTIILGGVGYAVCSFAHFMIPLIVPSLQAIVVLTKLERFPPETQVELLITAAGYSALPIWIRSQAVRKLSRRGLSDQLNGLAVTDLPERLREVVNREIDKIERQLQQGGRVDVLW